MSLPKWLSWRSGFLPIWLWHAMFDGTVLCRCKHSEEYRRYAKRSK